MVLDTVNLFCNIGIVHVRPSHVVHEIKSELLHALNDEIQSRQVVEGGNGMHDSKPISDHQHPQSQS